ncbi:phosphocholine cytidylyltransferase family protein [bacterium]|nr:MAG: phosphocholine cytidylyltransferase family protein [bacterium]
MKAIILAAGIGKRLGNIIPKCLTELADGKSIIEYQIEKLTEFVGLHNIYIVVGYKKTLIMERFPNLIYIYAERFAHTNTSKSLLCALEKTDDDVIWLNGDVFFDASLPWLLTRNSESAALVDNKKCGEEEIKYNVDSEGYIREISKQVEKPIGEALGINFIIRDDVPFLVEELRKVGDNDYFEKAIENLTLSGKLKIRPVDKGDYFCEEIDFPEDLELVNNHLSGR